MTSILDNAQGKEYIFILDGTGVYVLMFNCIRGSWPCYTDMSKPTVGYKMDYIITI
jgi:hypothetical protein